ncbi:MAG: YggS family pyridoxal phosphate-dependent enzyme [Planctomycetota bacterium]|nr:MAG: YggS family pyridoxal phosphate-dependent enzyme [Planctomycetota bacterium]
MITKEILDPIRRNLESIQHKIQISLQNSPRPQRPITLVAVTKYYSPLAIQALLEIGHEDIGESYVLKGIQKARQIIGSPRWHLIGHLQRNKVNKALPFYQLIHSLDSARLATKINQTAQRLGRPADCLLQLNLSGETTKFGLPPSELDSVLELSNQLPYLRILGLMTIAPHTEDRKKIRSTFQQLYRIQQAYQKDFPLLQHLSMGMSSDYPIAIEEGATIIRVGKAIFQGIPANRIQNKESER